MTEAPTDDAPEQIRVRREKRERLLATGQEAYPVGVPRTHTIAQVRAAYPDLEAGTETDDEVGVAGRVVFVRIGGKLCFATLQDGEGNRLQAMFSLDAVGEERLAAFKTDVDLGDHLFVHGRVISSRRGELSVLADAWQIAAKSLRPLPNLYEGVELSEEARVRQRYVDLIVRPQARQTARLRPAMIRSLRDNFHARDFIEIETPMLQTQPGGAAARPFVTHMNAFDIDLYMRIAPELFLKRAVVGGIERVFEINRNFRNEGADSTHSPEFAMLEAYEAYGDYDTMAELTRNLVQTRRARRSGHDDGDAARRFAVRAGRAVGAAVDVRLAGRVAGYCDHARDVVGRSARARAEVRDRGRPEEDQSRQARRALVGAPGRATTCTRRHSCAISRWRRARWSASTARMPGVVEKWDLYVRGVELATGYSELVDPVIQRQRFEAQALLAAAGDDEAMRVDEDFLTAVEYALPPSGGIGLGIDRLLMTLTGLGIRETILFPLVKPQV